MINFQELAAITALVEKWLPEIENLYKDITSLNKTAATPTALPSRVVIGRHILLGLAKRQLVLELEGTGKVDRATAQQTVDEGMTPAPVPPPGPTNKTEAGGKILGNILTWMKANGPTLAADAIQAIPQIIQLITLFSSL
jgi:hypothetical protein